VVIVDYPWIPTAMWTDDEISDLVDVLYPAVRAALLGEAAPTP